MTAQNAKDYLPLIQALAEGKTVQVRLGEEWTDCLVFGWNNPPDHYRIKPEPRVLFAVFREDLIRLGVFNDIKSAEDYAKDWSGKVVKFQEVL